VDQRRIESCGQNDEIQAIECPEAINRHEYDTARRRGVGRTHITSILGIGILGIGILY
jgi:hypothetical protein